MEPFLEVRWLFGRSLLVRAMPIETLVVQEQTHETR